ncbi:MAG: arylsulfatase [Acidobacteria bacterium]|nr:arylsulfatase [Acidobacteriota bacterium]
MERRQLLRGALGTAVSASVGGPLRAQPRRPNIVLILADDMGFSDLGCYGSEISTPNLDGLARRGIRFTQFTNFARCCPTRAALMTGLYPHQAGLGHMWYALDKPVEAYQGYLNRRCVTIAEALRPGGYRTLMAGKWHLAGDHGKQRRQDRLPRSRGFDHYYGHLGGTANYFRPNLTPNGVVPQFLDDDEPIDPGSREGESYYTTDAFTSRAVKWIGEYGREERPFFLYAAYNAPHFPLHALPEDIAKHRGRYRQGWEEIRLARYRRMLDLGLFDRRVKLPPRDPRSPAWSDVKDKDAMDLRMAVYAAQIDRLDRGVGEILRKIREIGQEENTLVMFLSDNGGTAEHQDRTPHIQPGQPGSFHAYGLPWANVSNTPFGRYKHWVHEGGIATPMIASWPGVIRKTNTITHQPGHVIDIMATCLAAAGVPYPKEYGGSPIQPLEGRSLLPVFEGRSGLPERAVFWEHEGNRAVRRGKWKLVSYVSKAPEDRWELYDLEADRTELNDLAGRNPRVAAELRSLYEHWAKRCGVLGRTGLEAIVGSGRLVERL